MNSIKPDGPVVKTEQLQKDWFSDVSGNTAVHCKIKKILGQVGQKYG
jgi:hypothetical protein